ncbi:MAG: hypothetical protein WA208_21225, partial [Thermoanaerobaculia bacterium]
MVQRPPNPRKVAKSAKSAQFSATGWDQDVAALLEALPAAVMVVKPDGTRIAANRRADVLLGGAA